MLDLSGIKVALKGLKWGVIGAVMLSGWIMAAWIKADLRPDRIDPLPTTRRVEIVAQKPDKGQQWAIHEGAKVRYLSREEKKQTSHSGTPSDSHTAGSPSLDSTTQTSLSGNQGTDTASPAVLPLGRFLTPASGREPLWVTPELDPVTGETKLQVEPAGGFARFGGERFAFIDLSYQRLLQSDLSLSSVPALAIGLHQDLGRLGKLELMAEGWLQASLLETPQFQSVEFGIGAKLRVALPF